MAFMKKSYWVVGTVGVVILAVGGWWWSQRSAADAVQYRTANGEGLAKGIALARKMAGNAPMSAFAVMHALPRIAEQSADHGFFTEAMMAAIAQSAPEAKERVKAFLDGKAAKVRWVEFESKDDYGLIDLDRKSVV